MSSTASFAQLYLRVFSLGLLIATHTTFSQSIRNQPLTSLEDLEDASNHLFPPSSISKIIGGSTVTSSGKYPWFSLLLTQNVNGGGYGIYGCGATLVTDEFLITAAHCIDRPGNSSSSASTHVGIGVLSTRRGNQGQRLEIIPIEKTFVHPLYSTDNVNFVHDIALIQISKSSTITPLHMDMDGMSESYTSGKNLTTIGFGCTSYFDQKFQENLREVELRYIPNESCTKTPFLYASWAISDDMMCAVDIRKAICNGDSGGPLYDVENNMLVGVASWGVTPFNDFRYPSVFSRISDQFPSWIKPTICSNLSTDEPHFCKTNEPSQEHSTQPSVHPSRFPSLAPSLYPSNTPSVSSYPSVLKSEIPSNMPSVSPTIQPSTTTTPTVRPTYIPSNQPSLIPSSTPYSYTKIPTPATNSTITTTKSPTACDMDYRLELMTDNYGEEISWDIVYYETGDIAASSQNKTYPSDESIVDEGCISSNCFVFTIRDSFGDGLCCGHGSGRYNLYIDDVLLGYGSTFESKETILFGKCRTASDSNLKA